jgi:hypothetical protein
LIDGTVYENHSAVAPYLRQFRASPGIAGSPSTVHRYFQEWSGRRVFHRFWKKCLQTYDVRRGIGWRWQALDGSMTKAPLGGEKNR